MVRRDSCDPWLGVPMAVTGLTEAAMAALLPRVALWQQARRQYCLSLLQGLPAEVDSPDIVAILPDRELREEARSWALWLVSGERGLLGWYRRTLAAMPPSHPWTLEQAFYSQIRPVGHPMIRPEPSRHWRWHSRRGFSLAPWLGGLAEIRFPAHLNPWLEAGMQPILGQWLLWNDAWLLHLFWPPYRPAANPFPRLAAALLVPPLVGQAPGTYRVKPGDTLWRIAAARSGNGADWQQIYAANRRIIRQPDQLQPGMVLVLPPTRSPERHGSLAESPVPTIIIRSGDTLWSLARRHGGHSSWWPQLWRVNRDRLSRPDRLPVGLALRWPPGWLLPALAPEFPREPVIRPTPGENPVRTRPSAVFRPVPIPPVLTVPTDRPAVAPGATSPVPAPADVVGSPPSDRSGSPAAVSPGVRRFTPGIDDSPVILIRSQDHPPLSPLNRAQPAAADSSDAQAVPPSDRPAEDLGPGSPGKGRMPDQPLPLPGHPRPRSAPPHSMVPEVSSEPLAEAVDDSGREDDGVPAVRSATAVRVGSGGTDPWESWLHPEPQSPGTMAPVPAAQTARSVSSAVFPEIGWQGVPEYVVETAAAQKPFAGWALNRQQIAADWHWRSWQVRSRWTFGQYGLLQGDQRSSRQESRVDVDFGQRWAPATGIACGLLGRASWWQRRGSAGSGHDLRQADFQGFGVGPVGRVTVGLGDAHALNVEVGIQPLMGLAFSGPVQAAGQVAVLEGSFGWEGRLGTCRPRIGYQGRWLCDADGRFGQMAHGLTGGMSLAFP